jgi:hypothetical protein
MASEAQKFEERLDGLKEFVDDEGRQYVVMKFTDDSGRVFQKTPTDDGVALAEFTIQSQGAKQAMENISSATDFEFNPEANTQQNLRNLMSE